MVEPSYNYIIRELLADFYENPFPPMTPRQVSLPEIPGCATIVTGMRRTGKTYLLYQRMQELIRSGVDKSQLLYINFEDDRLLGMTVEDLRLITDLFYHMHPDNREKQCWFFFDEIQNIEHWESYIRRMIDSQGTQIYLSGSSAKMLSQEIATAMRGRSIEYELLPFSLEEFLIHHGYFASIPPHIGSASRSRIENGLEKYFAVGGMPAVQNLPDQLRLRLHQSYINAVIYRDVAERHSIPGTQTLKFIMQMIFNNPARQISTHKIFTYLKSRQIKTSREQVSDYLDYLTEAYLLHRVSLFTDSATRRRSNPDKYYLNDIGLIQSMRQKHTPDLGPLLENLVFLHFHRMGLTTEYVLSSDGSEIDFITFHQNQDDYSLYQVCYDLSDAKTFEREISVLREIGNALNISRRYIITWNDEKMLDDSIRVLPVWRLLLQIPD